MSGLLPVAEAQARLLDGVAALAAETVPLAQAAGRRAAADVHALLTHPPTAVSAMDGYAIRWDDRVGPWTVIGEAPAGHGFAGIVGAGEAVRIFTGAPVPDGADTVAVQEEVARDGGTARLTGEGPPRQGANIRPRGLDFTAGGVVAQRGDRLTAARIGLLAASGHGSVAVPRRPRVVVLATGDELVAPGTAPGAGGIVSSSGVMLCAMLGGEAEVRDGGIIPDRREALAEALRAAADADLILTIGGASVGDHDLVGPVLRDLGAMVDFWKIALRPGKPMIAARLGDTRVIGLPGNPVSAFVCAMLFARPLLRALGGDPHPLPVRFTARLGAPLGANNAREDYLRAVAVRTPDGPVVTATARQDSSMLGVLAGSNALIVRAAHAPASESDAIVECVALDFVPGVAHTFP